MQVILFQTVEQLGMQGDVVNVAAGYYRNFLGPRGYAIEATEGNLRQSEAKRKKLKAEAEKQVQTAKAYADRLAGVKLEFAEKANPEGRLFGAIHDREVLDALKAQGFDIERRQVLIKEPIKAVGQHTVRIRLLQGVETTISVIVKAIAVAEAAEAEAEEKAEAKAEPEAQPAE
ncbi:50S ribosomal protein L9 [bacterium]|nr:50S ribosomal protein L9 [bacterium]